MILRSYKVGVGALVLAVVLTRPHSQTHAQARDQAVIPPSTLVGAASISGRVLVTTNGQQTPVRRARVTVEGGAADTAQVVVDADAEGRYRVEHLASGSYRVTAEKPGFVPVLQGSRHAFDPPPAVDIAAGQSLALDLMMQAGAALEGRLTSENGEPVANLVVSAIRLTYGSQGRQPTPVRQARTDDHGQFRLHTLPAGDYYIDAAPDPRAQVMQGPPSDRPTGLARTYFPGTANLSDARLVTLVTGQNADQLNFAVGSVPLARITGQVTDSSGRTIMAPMMTVRLQTVGSAPVSMSGSMMPQRPDFIYPAVPPGDYWLMATVLAAPGAPPEFSVQRVTVSGQDLTNVTITTAKGALVSGRVEVEGGAAAVPGGLQIVATQTDFELPTPPGAPPVAAPVNVGADGSFTLNGVFGPRQIDVTHLPAGWALKSVRAGDVDISDTRMDFKGRDAVTLRLVVTRNTGTVNGSVQSGDATPLAEARVVVFSQDDKMWGPRSRVVKSVMASRDGHFAIDGLLPGNYFVVGRDYLEEGSWMDPDVLARLKPLAASVTVAAGKTLTMTLRAR